MNKKTNTILFILGATVFNLLTVFLLLTLGIILTSLILQGRDPGGMGSLLLFAVFLLAVGGSFFIYHRAVKFLSRKIDIDRYFDPLIKPRQKK